MTHTLTLQDIRHVTHDTVHLTFDRPEGYDFRAGQANRWGLDVEGMRDAAKPFTITSLPDEPRLEFVVKTYPVAQHPEHDGVTERIGKMEAGERIFVGDPYGDIRDEGPGVFVAGGAGVTPFIPILKARRREGTLGGCTLLYSNKAERDIILRETWDAMEADGLAVRYTVTEEEDGPFPKRQTDAALIRETTGLDHRFYVCGPPPMMKAVIADLRDAGVPDDRITVETKWLE
jgi:ferredoxin-NADP reductase